ncbi:unnamed protein product [Rotaria socialis]|uniref:t-SNARE coiled-coil homology domain-containing protein n=1 Tax=Rotaria socialis TaxID=392032 RepID=A0A818EWI7_9BILA|nr:unnamed protein product [Rotaria socialis]
MYNSTDDELLKIDDCIDTWSTRMTSASDFQRLYNALSNNQTKISNNVTDLERLVQKFGTPEDSEPLRERYHRLQNETKVLMQQTNSALQELNNTRVLTEADQRRKKTLTENLPKQYLSTLNRFQEAQRIGARKEKESLDRARAISFRQQGISDSPFADDFVSAPTQDQLQKQVVLPMEQEVDMRSLRERDEQLRELETNIVEVNELFKDVAKLVHEQGTVIDSIQNHVEVTAEQTQQATRSLVQAERTQRRYLFLDSIDEHIINTEMNVTHGNQHLTKAVTYQSSARRKKIILVSVLLIVIAIIILVLVLTLKK